MALLAGRRGCVIGLALVVIAGGSACVPDPEQPAASLLSLLVGSFFDARIRAYHAQDPGPALRCGGAPDECDALFELPHLPFDTCGRPLILLKRLYACRYAERAGIGTCDLDDADTLRALRRMAPRMKRYFELGADMAAGGGASRAEDEDGFCSECQVRGGCAHSSGGYAGPQVEAAIHWAILLRRDFGAHWQIPTLDTDLDDLVSTPEQIGVDNSLFFNQFNYPSGNQLLWAEQRCDEALWRDGFETQNERFWRFRSEGARELYAVHYAVHHWDQVAPLTSLGEPTAAAQAEAMVDLQLAAYSATTGAGGMVAPLHVRQSSGQLWQGVALRRNFTPILYAFIGSPPTLASPRADSLPFQAWTTTGYRPGAAIQQLAGGGEREVWWRVHNNLGSRMPHSHHSWLEGAGAPVRVANTVPQQCYVAPEGVAMLCAQHQRSNNQGADLVVQIHAPGAPDGVLTGVHVQSQVAGDTYEDGSSIFGAGTDPELFFHGNPDGAQWIVPGRFGALGVRLVDPRARTSRLDGVTPVVRGVEDTRLMMPVHRASGALTKHGSYTCDGGVRAGLACDPGAGHSSTDCPGAQGTCNQWRVVQVGNAFVGYRILGGVSEDSVVARSARFTAVPGDPHTVCRGVGDPTGCVDIPAYYERIRTKRGRAVGSLWWVAHRDHGFASRGSFLAFLESLHVDFRADAPIAGGGDAPQVVVEARNDIGRPIYARLDYWKERTDTAPTRAVCTAAQPADCDWASSEMAPDAVGPYGIRHGPLAAWTLPDRRPLISWDEEDGTLRIHGESGDDRVHRWHDLYVDTDGRFGAPEPLPRLRDGARCGP